MEYIRIVSDRALGDGSGIAISQEKALFVVAAIVVAVLVGRYLFRSRV